MLSRVTAKMSGCFLRHSVDVQRPNELYELVIYFETDTVI